MNVYFGKEMAVALSGENNRRVIWAAMDRGSHFTFRIQKAEDDRPLTLAILPDGMGMLLIDTGMEDMYQFGCILKQVAEHHPVRALLEHDIRKQFPGTSKTAKLPVIFEPVGGVQEDHKQDFIGEYYFVCSVPEEEVFKELSSRH